MARAGAITVTVMESHNWQLAPVPGQDTGTLPCQLPSSQYRRWLCWGHNQGATHTGVKVPIMPVSDWSERAYSCLWLVDTDCVVVPFRWAQDTDIRFTSGPNSISWPCPIAIHHSAKLIVIVSLAPTSLKCTPVNTIADTRHFNLSLIVLDPGPGACRDNAKWQTNSINFLVH